MADNPIYPNNAYTQALTQGLGRAPEMGPPPQPGSEIAGEREAALKQLAESMAPTAPPPADESPKAQGPTLPLTRFIGIDLDNQEIVGDNGQTFKIPEDAIASMNVFCLNVMKVAQDQLVRNMAASMGLEVTEDRPDGSNQEMPEVPSEETPAPVRPPKRRGKKAKA